MIPAIRALGLEGFLDGSRACTERFLPNLSGEGLFNGVQAEVRVNLDYVTWIRTDQAIMVWLLGSISETMLGHVVRCTSAQQVWSTLSSLFLLILKLNYFS